MILNLIILKMNENINVSYDFIYKTLTKEGILYPKARKKTKRKYAKQKLLKEKKINNGMSNDEIEIIVNHEIVLEDSHPRGKNLNTLVKLLNKTVLFINGLVILKTCLHHAIDKATSTIVGAYFDKAETLNGYYNVLYQILTNHGIPCKFLANNRTVFNYISLNPNKRTSDKDVLTQYGYACSILNTDLKTTSVSQSKGTIERTN